MLITNRSAHRADRGSRPEKILGGYWQATLEDRRLAVGFSDHSGWLKTNLYISNFGTLPDEEEPERLKRMC